MTFNPKERLRRALQFEATDRIPTQINYTGRMGQKMAAHFDIQVGELPAFLDNHLVRLDLTYPARYSDNGRLKFDWWGVGFNTREEGYFAEVNPLADAPDLDRFPWPDPDDPRLLAGAEEVVQEKGKEYFIVPNFGFALFERAWALRGFEQFFLDMAADPAYAYELLDRITETQLVLIGRYLELGVDGGYFGDDYGAQKGLLFSPRMWRQYIKPRLAKLFAPFCERKLPVIMHSDGMIQKILPDLVEIGVTTLNPVQPEVLDHGWLKEHYGGKLSFYGGISTQSVLPGKRPEAVKTAVFECVDSLAVGGTGFLMAPSHRMMSDIPMVNVIAMLEAFQSLA